MKSIVKVKVGKRWVDGIVESIVVERDSTDWFVDKMRFPSFEERPRFVASVRLQGGNVVTVTDPSYIRPSYDDVPSGS